MTQFSPLPFISGSSAQRLAELGRSQKLAKLRRLQRSGATDDHPQDEVANAQPAPNADRQPRRRPDDPIDVIA